MSQDPYPRPDDRRPIEPSSIEPGYGQQGYDQPGYDQPSYADGQRARAAQDPFAQRDDDREGPHLTGFPFPGVTGTTKGGVRYQVGGCCLPIPLGCLTVLAAAAAAAVAARVRR